MYKIMKKILFISILFNTCLLISLLYLFSKAVFPTIEKVSITNSLNYKLLINSRTYIDKKTDIRLYILETENYYPSGSLATKKIEINGIIKSFKSYSKKGKLLGSIINGKGRLIIPNIKGKAYPKDTVFPFSHCNCYYDNGAYLTEEEFNKRKTEKFKKEYSKFKKNAPPLPKKKNLKPLTTFKSAKELRLFMKKASRL